MLAQEQKTILGKLGYYISFLVQALPPRSIPTFCELLITSMITSEGFVTQSWLQGRLQTFGAAITSGWKQDAGKVIELLPALCSYAV